MVFCRYRTLVTTIIVVFCDAYACVHVEILPMSGDSQFSFSQNMGARV